MEWSKMLYMTFGLIFILELLTLPSTLALNAISIDFGTGWMKVGLVKPGVPMEIVLNPESQRKTPSVVSLKDKERLFGSSAQILGLKSPNFVYSDLLRVIGSRYGSPIAKYFQKTHPYYKVVNGSEFGELLFQHPDGEKISPEVLVAMLFQYAKETAEVAAEGVISESVIVVPPFFTFAERKAVEHAGTLAGLNVRQVMNDNTAVALQYTTYRHTDFTKEPKNILFYDFGYGSVTSTIVSFSLQDIKEDGKLVTKPVVDIKATAYDRLLGGLEFEYRLRDHLASQAQKQKGVTSDVKSNRRAMAKLLKEAGRVMKILSANAETFAQVEGLIDDVDFKCKVTREEFEKMTSDLLDRVKQPVRDALLYASMEITDIEQIILFGGCTRIPRVQDIILQENNGRELGKSLNTDEAATLGAVFQAAAVSKAFRVKDIVVKDSVIHPVVVSYSKCSETSSKDCQTIVTKTLFHHGNSYPQSKAMSFRNNFEDFSFHVNYGSLNFLSEISRQAFDTYNISKVFISGLTQAIDQHGRQNFKGVKVHFRMDASGLLAVVSAEATFEIVSAKEPSKGMLEKITGFFTGDSSKEEGDVQQEEELPSNNGNVSEASLNSSNDTSSEQSTSKNSSSTSPKVEAPKNSVISVGLEIREEYFDRILYSTERVEKEKALLSELKQAELAKKEFESARNKLESFIYETKDKLEQEEYILLSTQDERSALLKQLDESSEWLEENMFTASTKDIKTHINATFSLFEKIIYRRKEQIKRPIAIDRYRKYINASQEMILLMKNQTARFTESDITGFGEILSTSLNWFEDKLKKQSDTPSHVDPVLTVKSIQEEFQKLDREIKYYSRKPFPTPVLPKVSIVPDKPEATPSASASTGEPEATLVVNDGKDEAEDVEKERKVGSDDDQSRDFDETVLKDFEDVINSTSSRPPVGGEFLSDEL